MTINALFYNLNTKQIEDYTEKGIDDLKYGIVRTPLPALQTFLDDPLRVLRTIRFATRFNFLVADDVIEAAQQKQIAVSTKLK